MQAKSYSTNLSSKRACREIFTRIRSHHAKFINARRFQ